MYSSAIRSIVFDLINLAHILLHVVSICNVDNADDGEKENEWKIPNHCLMMHPSAQVE
jgi:hypothetical protein